MLEKKTNFVADNLIMYETLNSSNVIEFLEIFKINTLII